MKRKISKFRPSPNEEARIIREERERRRKLRIQQVREQQRNIALQICREVEQRRQYELHQLEEKLREDWERRQREKLLTLQRLYQESIQTLGEGHRSAKENELDLEAIAQRKEEDLAKAEERFKDALKELKTQKIKDNERQSHFVNARKKALEAERERSSKIASLPPPPQKTNQYFDLKRPRIVKKFDVNSFAGTHYHMPESAVDKEADTTQANAHDDAELETARLQELETEEKRKREEQLEKARLRGKQALRREQLVQDRERLLVELEHMQQTDLLRRRQQLSKLPPQIFQPLYQRQELREDFQRELEFAFEDMYTGERRVKGDLVVKLVPEPLPDLSACSQDQELDVTLEEPIVPESEMIPHDTVASTEQETSAEGEASQPRRTIRKLLDRIRNQRNEWASNTSHVPSSDSTSFHTDQISERETTIETGSIVSEVKDKERPHSLPPVVEPSEQQPAADLVSHTHITATRESEERKKRDEELDKAKQQQLRLLEDLEKQKVELEQMLMKAQEKRELLKTAVDQQAPISQPEMPAQDQSVTSLTSAETVNLVNSAEDDEHGRRIKEYQQRLLTQNRIHQRSVEVARQRLEEYQKALRIRYNMTSRSSRPTAITHPALPSAHLPAQLLRAPTVPMHIYREAQVPVEICTWTSDSNIGESTSNRPGIQRTNIPMESVTEHLADRMKPSYIAKEHPAQPHHTPSVPLQPNSFSPRPSCSSTTDGAPRALQPGRPSCTIVEIERQKKELQEVQRRLLKQKEILEQQQKEQVERLLLHRRMEEMGKVHASVSTEQPLSDSPSEAFGGVEDITDRRKMLLSSLLKALEESHGGSLSHLEDSEDSSEQLQTDHAPAQINVSPSIAPEMRFHRAPKPPVTRLRPGFMMADQHELSAIQEVETPVNISQVAENNVTAPSHSLHWNTEESVTPHVTPRPFVSSTGPAEESNSSEESSQHVWRERLLSGAGTSPEVSDSSDSGRGADFLVAGLTNYRRITESPRKRSGSDCLSSTISTGSYVPTDPEQNPYNGKFSHIQHRVEDGSRPDVPAAEAEQSSAFSRPGFSLDLLMNDSSVQHIIDRYTRELNLSLSSGGRTDSNASYVEEVDSVAPQQTERGGVGGPAVPQQSAEESDFRIPQHIPGEHPSLAEDQDQSSFRPLIGQLTDQSSFLLADPRDSAMERLVGHPSAHSSMIAQPPVFDQSEWDSVLSRQLAQLSEHPGSHEDQDRHTDRRVSEPSWLADITERTEMRPLVGELDQSEGRHAESPENTESLVVGNSEESTVSLNMVFSSETSTHSRPVSGLNSPTQDEAQQAESSLVNPACHTTEGSFHPLPAEMTHDETADSPEAYHSASTLSADTNPFESESSPEHFRAEPNLQACFSPAAHHSDPIAGTVDQMALILSNIIVEEEVAVVDTSQPEMQSSDTEKSFPSFHAPLEQEAQLEQNQTVIDIFSGTDELEAAEEGILNQSQITLVSLTDTTLQDPETNVTEEEEEEEEEPETEELPHRLNDDKQEEQGFKSTPVPETDHTAHPEVLLEFQMCSGKSLQDVFQEKCGTLLQRSNRRLEEIKAKRMLAKSQCEEKNQLQQLTYKAKSSSELQNDTKNKQKTERTEQPEFLACEPHLKNVMKICTPEQRKHHISEMHQRTQRLYEQLEEVKHQKAVKSRQEDYARNRLKAKEFHKKTLQKLRAKQTR